MNGLRRQNLLDEVKLFLGSLKWSQVKLSLENWRRLLKVVDSSILQLGPEYYIVIERQSAEP